VEKADIIIEAITVFLLNVIKCFHVIVVMTSSTLKQPSKNCA